MNYTAQYIQNSIISIDNYRLKNNQYFNEQEIFEQSIVRFYPNRQIGTTTGIAQIFDVERDYYFGPNNNMAKYFKNKLISYGKKCNDNKISTANRYTNPDIFLNKFRGITLQPCTVLYFDSCQLDFKTTFMKIASTIYTYCGNSHRNIQQKPIFVFAGYEQ